MTHPEVDYWIRLERRRDELAAAEQSRLVRMALDARKENQAPRSGMNFGVMFQSALHWLGQGLFQLGLRFQEWGCQLQVRNSAVVVGGRTAPCK